MTLICKCDGCDAQQKDIAPDTVPKHWIVVELASEDIERFIHFCPKCHKDTLRTSLVSLCKAAIVRAVQEPTSVAKG